MSDTHKPNPGAPKVLDFPESESLQDQAASWVSKLDANDLDPESIQAFKQWIRQSPEHKAVFEKNLAIWSDMNVLTGIVPPAQAQQDPAKTHRSAWSLGWPQGLAACCVFALTLLSWQWYSAASSIYSTAIGEQRMVQLPDGTDVLLNTNTEFKTAYTEQRRSIYLLRGEAHFDVAHNPDRPFEVHAGYGGVRAVGTAFTVYLRSDDVEVVVTEGAIEIFPAVASTGQQLAEANTKPPEPEGNAAAVRPEQNPQASAARVEAGNVATYDRHTAQHIMQQALDKADSKLSWQQGMLVFRSEALEVVIKEVNRYTEIKIVIPDQKIRHMKVGGFFKVSNIESVFQALEEGFDIHAERVADDMVYLVHRE